MLDNETLFSLLAKGGIMQIFIALSSVAALAIIIERYFTYARINRNSKNFEKKLGEYFAENKIAEATEFARKSETVVAAVVSEGLNVADLGKERVADTIETAGKKVIFDLEKGLSTLATIAGVAPLLGFLGTVTGMISAFMQIQNLEGVVNPSDLAGGIWEALITTASGLAVGIVALTAYNYFVAQVKKIALEIESAANMTVNKIAEIEKR
jgi:biopolymer transport protein ExbB